MIRLMLASYSRDERQKLASIFETAQVRLADLSDCKNTTLNCHTCENRHICTDLLAAAVYAHDYNPAPEK